ncbi:MAG: hypothetical protein K6T65_06905 [Peptococcaceae bacterium]|nr:hypothetical protein [Peptococcaceae bacterium]
MAVRFEEEGSMSNEANPYILFLILILLILGFDSESGKKVEMIKNIVVRMTSTMDNFFSGIASTVNDFGEIQAMLMDMHRTGGRPN